MLLKIPYNSKSHKERIEMKRIIEYERRRQWKRIARSRHMVTVVTFDGNEEYYDNVAAMGTAFGIRPERLWRLITTDKKGRIDYKISDIIINEAFRGD